MSRYWDDGNSDGMPAELWEANLSRALTGKRGQKALADLRAALMELPERRLISRALCTMNAASLREELPESPPYVRRELDELVAEQGEGVCLVGAYVWYQEVRDGAEPAAAFAKLPMLPDYGNDMHDTVVAGNRAGLTWTLAWDLAFRNDETWAGCTPGERWQKALDWIDSQLASAA